MGLEAGTYVNDLVTTNPVVGDPVGQGDDHLRLLKTILKNTFPGFTRPFYQDNATAGSASITLTATDDRGFFAIDCAAASRTVTLPTAPSTGYEVTVTRTDTSTANLLTIARGGTDTINSLTSYVISTRFACVKFKYIGSNIWIALHGNIAGANAIDLTSDNQATFFATTFGGNASFLGGRRGRGTAVAPTAVLASDALFNVGGRGQYGPTVAEMSGTQALLTCRASENWSAVGRGTYWEFYTQPTGSVAGQVPRWRIENTGEFLPVADNAYNVGNGTFRAKEIFAAAGVINTSDEEEKVKIGKINFGWDIIDDIQPWLFKWKIAEQVPTYSKTETYINDDGEQVPKIEYIPRVGVRIHSGFLAQDVKKAIDKQGIDIGVWGLTNANDPKSRQWLRYDEMLPFLWSFGARAKQEIKDLKAENKLLKDTLTALEARVTALGG